MAEPDNYCYLLKTWRGFARLENDDVKYMSYDYYKKVWEGNELFKFRMVRKYGKKKMWLLPGSCHAWKSSDLIVNRDIRCFLN